MINNNYLGISIYDKDFNFLQSIDLDEDLLVYKIYSSSLNNYAILLDVDNEHMYIINIQSNTSITKKIQNNNIFSDYYFVEKENFFLRNFEYEYCYSYTEGKLLSTFQNFHNNVLCNYQDQQIHKAKNRIIYCSGGIEKDISINYFESYRFLIEDGRIFAFDESAIYTYQGDKLKRIWSSDHFYTIRSVSLADGKVYILLNSKTENDNSKIEIYHENKNIWLTNDSRELFI